MGATLAVARRTCRRLGDGTGQARPLRSVPWGRPLRSPAGSAAASATGRDKPVPYGPCRGGAPCGRPPDLPPPRRRDGTSPSPTVRAVGAPLAVARRTCRRLGDGTGQARPLRSVPWGRPLRSPAGPAAASATGRDKPVPYGPCRGGDPCGRPPDLPQPPRRDGTSPSPTVRAVGATLVVARRICRRLRDGTGQARPLRSVPWGRPLWSPAPFTTDLSCTRRTPPLENRGCASRIPPLFASGPCR